MYNAHIMSTSHLAIAALILSSITLIAAIYAIITARSARYWRNHFSKEEEPENLEEIIERIAAKLKHLEEKEIQNDKVLSQLTATLATAIQHVGVIRFDSAADDGGNLSFSAALLDAHQSGIILTSLHGRQHNRIYTKQIKLGKSEHILSEEETEALMQAITNNK